MSYKVRQSKDANLAIHECFVAVPDLVKKKGFISEQALVVRTQIHTAPEAFGKIINMMKPKHAVAYHFFKEGRWGEVDEVLRGVYKEASEVLGKKFEYPTKEEPQK